MERCNNECEPGVPTEKIIFMNIISINQDDGLTLDKSFLLN